MPEVTNVTAHLCSFRFASEWTRACRLGEALSASIHRKAAETKTAIEARAVVELFIVGEFAAAYGIRKIIF